VEFNTGASRPSPAFGAPRDADASGAAASDLSIFDAVREQLGLTLAPLRKGRVSVVIVDRAERPASN
jgi:uncharacterized protein (TIGR03435 family)